MYEGLLELFDKCVFYQEDLESITLKGKDGAEKIVKLMNYFREETLKEMAGIEVVTVEDYLKGEKLEMGTISEIELPKFNVLKYHLADGSWFCLRPSGTEPKAKFYFGVKAETLQASQSKLEGLKKTVMSKVKEILS
ncbi:hypothetical protein [Mesobacillus jeotgali]|uniref:phosphoglucomutase (alpha-D-glucose-1,6-bisphosphate-dependent) n=1 Tax=Mesobacillus jeotgali TaxID=129985 RepID=A0ABY9VJ86_9BACI|nr:hypothetical protein [Mesobacillus jeotgali]WNF22660.1 hypothetical protein RH061_21300 [Mesobacillus jeotgali]